MWGGLPVHLHRRDADRQGGPGVCRVPAGNVDVAKELDTTLDYTAEFVPVGMETFAAMMMDNDKGKIVPRYYRY